MKNQAKFLEFNGKNIIFLRANGTYYVAIKPICQALRVNYNRQYQKIKKHGVFGELFAIQQTVGADNRTRKMVCLPERYIYGWIFQIVAEVPELHDYQKKCCDLLYDHFHGTLTRRQELLLRRVEIEEAAHEAKAQLIGDPRYKLLAERETEIRKITKQLKEQDAHLAAGQMSIF